MTKKTTSFDAVAVTNAYTLYLEKKALKIEEAKKKIQNGEGVVEVDLYDVDLIAFAKRHRYKFTPIMQVSGGFLDDVKTTYHSLFILELN